MSLAMRRRIEEAALAADREQYAALLTAELFEHESAMSEAAARKSFTDRQDSERVIQRHLADTLHHLFVRPSLLAIMAAPIFAQPLYHLSVEAYRTYPNVNNHEVGERNARHSAALAVIDQWTFFPEPSIAPQIPIYAESRYH